MFSRRYSTANRRSFQLIQHGTSGSAEGNLVERFVGLRLVSGHILDIGVAVSPGSSDGKNSTRVAMTSRDTPTRRENDVPCRHTFSIKITPASATITGMFIAPTATSTIMRPQQQPTQYSPWWIPTRRSRSGPL